MGKGRLSVPCHTPPSPGGLGERGTEGPAPGGDAGEGLGPSQEPGSAEQTGEPGASAKGEKTEQVWGHGTQYSGAQGESDINPS